MQDDQYSSSSAGQSGSDEDDWLAGATVAASADEVSLGDIDVPIEGLEPSDPNVA